MSVVGSISIKDNASSVLKNVRKEQTELRKDAADTRKELQRTWDKTYTAKADTSSAAKKADLLTGKVKELGKKVASPVIRVKDAASSTVSKVTGGIKKAGSTIATPIIRVKDAATSTVTKVTNKIKGVGRKVTAPIIKVKDAASSVIGKVTGKLKAIGGKVFSPIVKLTDATAKGISAVGGKLASIAKTVSIPVSIAATAVIGGAVSQGASLEQSIGGVETLFKGDAGVVKANADAAFKTAGLSANEYMEQVTSFSASLLNSLGGDTATAAKVADMAMVDMSDNANKFGTDMDSISNAYQGFAKQNYTMLDNLKLGYGGTKEEMERLLKDAQTMTGVKYDISNLSDVYNAIHAVQENLGVTGTTAKEASQTFSGSFSAMKSAAKNVLGNMAIGGDVTGSMEQLVDSASTFLFKNAVPMIGRVVSSLPKVIKTGIKNAAPKIKASGGEIIKSLKDGIIGVLPSSMGGVVTQIFDSLGTLGSGFASIAPQLASFGAGMITTIQQVTTACLPMLTSIISNVTTMLPVILPVIQTVVSTIGSIIAQAAPVISGLVSAIGIAVTALAPVFSTIFSEIGEKVGSVISFVGERMGFIQEVIGTVAPLLGDIISTAWGVISPVIDIAISVFEILFGVVQKVFPGIQAVLEAVWGVVKPIIEGIGSVVGKVAGWLGSAADWITGSGDSDTGKNADGDNNWKGGLTWVGEKGAELVDLPKGSRILPHKESVSLAGQQNEVVKNNVTNITKNTVAPSQSDNSDVGKNADGDNNWKGGMTWVGEKGAELVETPSNSRTLPNKESISTGSGVVQNSTTKVVQNTVASGGTFDITPVLTFLGNIDNNLKILIDRIKGTDSGLDVPGRAKGKTETKGFVGSITVQIAKLAEQIIVREDADIDDIADKVAKKVVEVVVNMS